MSVFFATRVQEVITTMGLGCVCHTPVPVLLLFPTTLMFLPQFEVTLRNKRCHRSMLPPTTELCVTGARISISPVGIWQAAIWRLPERGAAWPLIRRKYASVVVSNIRIAPRTLGSVTPRIQSVG